MSTVEDAPLGDDGAGRYTLLDSTGRPYRSARPGQLGGHRRSHIYGRLDCRTAAAAIARGGYTQYQVFFLDEPTAAAAGYRPCAVCLPDEYRGWRAGQTSAAVIR